MPIVTINPSFLVRLLWYFPLYFCIFTCWNYGIGDHSSEYRHIPRSVVINVTASDGTVIKIHHLVLNWSSYWVAGRNVTLRKNKFSLTETAWSSWAPTNNTTCQTTTRRSTVLLLSLDLSLRHQPGLSSVVRTINKRLQRHRPLSNVPGSERWNCGIEAQNSENRRSCSQACLRSLYLLLHDDTTDSKLALVIWRGSLSDLHHYRMRSVLLHCAA